MHVKTDTRVLFPCHQTWVIYKESKEIILSLEDSSGTKPESSGTKPKSSGTKPESSGTKPESSETNGKSSGTRQKTSDKIIEMIKKDPQITAPQIAMELDISTRGVEKNLRQLRETGTLKRVGSPTFGGYWEIVNLDNE